MSKQTAPKRKVVQQLRVVKNQIRKDIKRIRRIYAGVEAMQRYAIQLEAVLTPEEKLLEELNDAPEATEGAATGGVPPPVTGMIDPVTMEVKENA